MSAHRAGASALRTRSRVRALSSRLDDPQQVHRFEPGLCGQGERDGARRAAGAENRDGLAGQFHAGVTQRLQRARAVTPEPGEPSAVVDDRVDGPDAAVDLGHVVEVSEDRHLVRDGDAQAAEVFECAHAGHRGADVLDAERHVHVVEPKFGEGAIVDGGRHRVTDRVTDHRAELRLRSNVRDGSHLVIYASAVVSAAVCPSRTGIPLPLRQAQGERNAVPCRYSPARCRALIAGRRWRLKHLGASGWHRTAGPLAATARPIAHSKRAPPQHRDARCRRWRAGRAPAPADSPRRGRGGARVGLATAQGVERRACRPSSPARWRRSCSRARSGSCAARAISAMAVARLGDDRDVRRAGRPRARGRRRAKNSPSSAMA